MKEAQALLVLLVLLEVLPLIFPQLAPDLSIEGTGGLGLRCRRVWRLSRLTIKNEAVLGLPFKFLNRVTLTVHTVHMILPGRYLETTYLINAFILLGLGTQISLIFSPFTVEFITDNIEPLPNIRQLLNCLSRCIPRLL